MDFLNRLLGWITGYHSYEGYSLFDPDPKCPQCEQHISKRCTGWPKKDK